jgi:hypothetical protein
MIGDCGMIALSVAVTVPGTVAQHWLKLAQCFQRKSVLRQMPSGGKNS